MQPYYVYILASRPNGALFVGITSDLIQCIWERKTEHIQRSTKRYNIYSLVFVEVHEDVFSALKREKHLNRWQRKKKDQLIEKHNPKWRDLFYTIV